MKKLNYFIKKDSRIKKVYDFAKQRFQKLGSLHYSFEHTLRVLCRVLIIAETEENVNYTILIPSVILHDIGETVEGEGHHIEKGIPLIKEILQKFNYSDEEIFKIVDCIKKHGGLSVENPIMPETVEEKILWDSDLLEKSGIAGAFSSYAVQLEGKKPIEIFAENRAKEIKNKLNSFFTKKAKEIDNNGMRKLVEHFERVAKNCKERKDWTIKEEDLWD